MNKELNAVLLPDESLELEWRDLEEPPEKSTKLLQKEIFNRFHAQPSWLLFLSFCDSKVPLSPSLAYWRNFTGLFARKLRLTPNLEELRHKVHVTASEEELHHYLESAPMMTGSEYLATEVLKRTWEELNQAFAGAVGAHDGSVESFIKTYSPDVHLVGRVYFHLVEQPAEDTPFAFLATYSTGLDNLGKSKHLPLKSTLNKDFQKGEKLLDLLSTVYTAAKESTFISRLLEKGELFHPLSWTTGEAFTFLKEIPLYETSGILCRIPNWWKGKTSAVSLNIVSGTGRPSLVGMEAILDFKPRLMLGDTPITLAEARKLLEESEGLAYIKNKWVAVDPGKLRQTIDAYEKATELMEEQGFTLREALRMQLNPGDLLGLGQEEDDDISLSRGEWLQSVMERLKDPALLPEVKPPKGFKARLRKYQVKGLNWLYYLHSLGFGACLADDMGLGKTIQLLAFLSVIKSPKKTPASLLVVPASLISNWVEEIHKFFPSLRYYVAHPGFPEKKGKENDTNTPPDPDRFDLVITSYGMSSRLEWIRSYTWSYIILDEAQAIKNPGTQQSKNIKKLEAFNRAILTGTPIENRLSDLWSLFDFLNPGLLGNRQEFIRFSKELKDHPEGYSKLRQLVMPFILRRLKTDKKVISDLPEKVEMKTYAPLSKKQAVLYGNLVQQIEEAILNAEGIERKGLVLASLMKFKQICNHPYQYLGTGSFEEKHSGKLERLREICETIYEKRERVLVFTQFKEITEHLAGFLEGVFGRKGLILHGSVAVKKRKTIIEEFQGDGYVPFMVLSIKAGGVGLNLTRANHVIHFDRWWNPAVENQATDRAFRIGQEKNVLVHKFITRGTVEEKIDRMLDEKSKLSEEIIGGTGEGWITEMNNQELMELFSLSL